MTEQVRVRFAPSPTGALHLGGARTAIYNWAFARRNGGVFILRIDDTDPERSTPENTDQIQRSLKWLGLDWDEGPGIEGAHAPYFQTLRSQHYTAALETMKQRGAVYPCFCTIEELEAKRAVAQETGDGFGYDRTCRTIPLDEALARIESGEPHVWRLRVPEGRGAITFEDAVRGETEFSASVMDDFVLVRTDGTPTYNFATVVDDADMQITHVIRGDDHLANTPRQILVFEALGREIPRFAHLSMIWGPDGKKLSKRHGATSVEAYADLGFLPEALLNYLALLGWSLDGETTILSADVLKANFSLERISKNPAIFDPEKLEWMNGVYLRDMPARDFGALIASSVVELGWLAGPTERSEDWWAELAPLVAERTKRLTDIPPIVRFLFTEVEIEDHTRAKALGAEGSAALLDAAVAAVSDCPWTTEGLELSLRALPERLGVKPKALFQAIRVALTGSTVSLPLFESLVLLGREEAVSRLTSASTIAS